jgi:hypothetical protein
MKLSKVTWIFLIVGILIIVGASLGMTHSRQSEQQNQLEQQVAGAKQKLSLIDNSAILAEQDQLQKDQSSYLSQLKSVGLKLRSDDDSISATEELLNAAPGFHVQVITLDSPGLSSENLVSTACDILSLNIQVDGQLADVNSYINNLSQIFPTGMVKSVQLSATQEQESTQAAASAKVSLVIYEYKGE